MLMAVGAVFSTLIESDCGVAVSGRGGDVWMGRSVVVGGTVAVDRLVLVGATSTSGTGDCVCSSWAWPPTQFPIKADDSHIPPTRLPARAIMKAMSPAQI